MQVYQNLLDIDKIIGSRVIGHTDLQVVAL